MNMRTSTTQQNYESRQDLHKQVYVVQSHLTEYDEASLPEYYSVKIVTSGREMYSIHKSQFPLTDSSVLLVNPGHNVHIQIQSNQPVNGTCYFFHPTLVRELYGALYLNDELLLERNLTSVPEHAMDFVTGLYSKSHFLPSQSSDTSLDSALKLLETAIQTSTLARKRTTNIGSTKSSTRQELYRKIMHTVDKIHDSIPTPFPPTIDDLAKEAGLSKFHYLRSFKAIMGQTPKQYMNRIRLEEAKAYLGTMPVNQLATNFGYADLPTFSKAFKRQFGFALSQRN